MVHFVLFLYVVLIFCAIVAIVHFSFKSPRQKNHITSFAPPIVNEDTPKEQLLSVALDSLIYQDLVSFEKASECLMKNHQMNIIQILGSLDISFKTLCQQKSYSTIFYLLKNFRSIVENRFDESSNHKDFIDDIIQSGDTLLLSSILTTVPDRMNRMNYDNWTTPLSFALLQKPTNIAMLNMLLDHDVKMFSIGTHDLNKYDAEKIKLPPQLINRFQQKLIAFDLNFFNMIVQSQ